MPPKILKPPKRKTKENFNNVVQRNKILKWYGNSVSDVIVTNRRNIPVSMKIESCGNRNLLTRRYNMHLASLIEPLSSCLEFLYEIPRITALFRPWAFGGSPGSWWLYSDNGAWEARGGRAARASPLRVTARWKAQRMDLGNLHRSAAVGAVDHQHLYLYMCWTWPLIKSHARSSFEVNCGALNIETILDLRGELAHISLKKVVTFRNSFWEKA